MENKLEQAYFAALELLDEAFAGSFYSFDIRERLIAAYSASARNIPDATEGRYPRNKAEMKAYIEAAE